MKGSPDHGDPNNNEWIYLHHISCIYGSGNFTDDGEETLEESTSIPRILWNCLYYKGLHKGDWNKGIIINMEGEIVWSTT